MRPFWHAVSLIRSADPPSVATPRLVRALLGSANRADLTYHGDRMWPALRHGEGFRVRAAGAADAEAGRIVLVETGPRVEVARVRARTGDAISLCADADPEFAETVGAASILGCVDAASRRSNPTVRRTLLDLAESTEPSPAAETVREKYDFQASSYAASQAPEIDAALLDLVMGEVGAGARVLVVGSGSGRECCALAEAGARVEGIDFSEAMIAAARRRAAARELTVAFRCENVASFRPPAESYDAVLFTYDVYSFLRGRAYRVEVLKRISSWLGSSGAIFLSARRAVEARPRIMLTLQWVLARGSREWGDSHTRWIDSEGTLRRSFVHYFTPAQVAAEIAEANLQMSDWMGGHCVLRPRPQRDRTSAR